jgi:type III restriction enzyme
MPPQRMEELRRGEVMIANWHRLAKQETSTVNGQSAKVVKTGEPVEIVKNEGKSNETREIKYFESDQAWFKRIRQELGSGRGRTPHWLVFNDEAHHAYRRGDRITDETDLEDDTNLKKKNAREATIWIEGLDRINKLAGGKKKGIRLCVDLSATPFYIQGSGNEVGKPFPWVVSDFGLLDAIESGLVKIPQLPSRDTTGAEEAAYFNIWRWVQEKAQQDGYGTDITPEIVMTYASAPINLLAQEWHQRFQQWQGFARKQHKHPVPPVFIVVCRDTRVAKAVYEWLADGEGGARRGAAVVPQPAGPGCDRAHRLPRGGRHRGRRHQERDPPPALYHGHHRQGGMAGGQGARGMVGAGAQAQREGRQ